MKCMSNFYCLLLKDLDMFGKEPTLYYKGRTKKTSLLGNIFTFCFIFLYFALFLYKLIRMIRKSDVSFYDTYTYEAEPPALNLTNNYFYGGFALEHPETYDVFIDEGIYYPKAYFKKAERKGQKFEWTTTEIELERCKLEKFGSFYQETFKLKPLDNYYCFKNVNFTLEGYFTYDLYSFFYIQFFPCVNTTEKHNCKPIEEIDFYLKSTFVSFLMENIELTPKNYYSPVKAKNEDIFTTINKNLNREVHAYFQIVKIETDMDIFGFDEFENFKTEVFLKYDEMVIMDQMIESDIYKTGESFCDFTLKLSELVRTKRRTYTKLITILGEIGGFVEIFYTLFRVLSSFSADILYDISLINELFDFNLDKKEIILKKYNNIKENESPKEEEEQAKYNNSQQSKIKFRYSNFQKEQLFTKDNKLNNEENINKSQKSIKFTSFNKVKSNNYIGKSNSNIALKPISTNKLLESIKITNIGEEDHQKIINKNSTKSNGFNIKVNNEKGKMIINQIKLNRTWIYLCFCCTRKRKNINNILLDEGINIISKTLDIFNLLQKLFEDEKVKEEKLKKSVIGISNECELKLKKLINK